MATKLLINWCRLQESNVARNPQNHKASRAMEKNNTIIETIELSPLGKPEDCGRPPDFRLDGFGPIFLAGLAAIGKDGVSLEDI
jgi:hypothetical protein